MTFKPSVLVTGASGGIGNQIIRDLAEKSKLIYGTFLVHEPRNFREINNFEYQSLDLRDLEGTKKFFNQKRQSFDVVVFAAGIAPVELIGNVDIQTLLDTFQINTVSTIVAINEVLPSMIERGFGRIIIISSIVGNVGGLGIAGYSASKSALHGLNRSVNREIKYLKQKINKNADVTINLITPGYVKSPMTEHMPIGFLEKIKNNTATNALIDPVSISKVVSWLIFEGKNITGSSIKVDDGIDI